MKIRNGFVSNSSSSSFVVAFPHKPNDVDDLMSMLGYKDGYNITAWGGDESISSRTVAEIIFNIIENDHHVKNKCDKCAGIKSVKRIAGEFHGRYHYNCRDNVMIIVDDKLVPLVGWCVSDDEPCFGVDKKLLDELKNVYIEENEFDRQYWKTETDMYNMAMADLGITEDMRRQDKDRVVSKKISEYLENNKKYQEIRDKNYTHRREFYDRMDKLVDKIAMTDAKEWMRLNKGRYVCVFEFSDNDGSTSAIIEHGNTFDKVPYIRISHH